MCVVILATRYDVASIRGSRPGDLRHFIEQRLGLVLHMCLQTD